MFYPVLINASCVPELNAIKDTNEGVVIGVGLSLSKLDSKLKQLIADLPSYKTRVFQAIVEMLRWFAGPQIRNVAVSCCLLILLLLLLLLIMI